MVIGGGMLATKFEAFKTAKQTIIFASGVSDSTKELPDNFERERILLKTTIENNPGKQLIYFSTCSIYDPSMAGSAYVAHKKRMELLVTGNAEKYIIFRLSNPVGPTRNNKTVLNYFIKNILEGMPFNVWNNASRNIIDLDDVYVICHHIITTGLFSNSIVNIANPQNYPVPMIVAAIEKHFGKKGNYRFADKGDTPKIDSTQIQPLFNHFNINFTDHYLQDLLQKYFPRP